MEQAQSPDRKRGPKSTISDEKAEMMSKALTEWGDKSGQQIAEFFGVCRATLYKRVKEWRLQKQNTPQEDPGGCSSSTKANAAHVQQNNSSRNAPDQQPIGG